MTDSHSDEQKLHIDEDWKSQVQAERDALGQPGTASAGPPEQSHPASSATEADEQPAHKPRPALPPASLSTLVTMLSTQAALLLGDVATSATAAAADARSDALTEARYLIDLLQVLDEKTTGQRTADESAQLDRALHELRMAYVSLSPGGNA